MKIRRSKEMKEKESNVTRLIAEAQDLYRLGNAYIKVLNYFNRSRSQMEEMRVRLKNFLHV